MMKIAFVDFAPLTFGGGAEKHIIDIAFNLSEKGHDVHIVTANQLAYSVYSFIMFHRLCPKRVAREQILQRLGKVNLDQVSLTTFLLSNSYRTIKARLSSCDVIYTKNEILDFLLLKALWKKSLPVICGIHTTIFYPTWSSPISKLHNLFYLSRIYGNILGQCSVIRVLNTFDLEFVPKYFGINESKVVWIPNPVDVQTFSSMENSETYGKFRILFAGRLTEQKGVDLLCHAIDILSLKPEFTRMAFTIAGSGKLDYLVLELCNRYKNIKYLGQVAHSQMPELYNAHDITVVPSRWEGMPNTCLEAQSCGVPVVVTNIPGSRDVVDDGKTGILIPSENAKALADAIQYLFELKSANEPKFAEMKKFARKNVKERFSMETIVRKLESMIIKVCRR